MALADVSTFQAALAGGLRANRYRVILNLPSGVNGDTSVFSLMVKASNVPAMQTGTIETNYKGKMVKNSGDLRPAGQWTVTALLENNTSGATAKKIAEAWQRVAFDEKDPAKYKTDATIELVTPDKSQTTVLKYKIEGIWIENSGELQLGDDTVDEILTMEIIFNYDDVLPLH